jgi:hypothetical protein
MNSTLPAGMLDRVLRRHETRLPTLALGWQSQAIAAYEQSRQTSDASLRLMLAERLRGLLGYEIDRSAIWVDRSAGLAITRVDGVLFRMERSRLMLVRPCAECGLGQLTSPELRTQADLGYALSAWQPHHPACQPEDPADYLDYL